MKDLFSKILAFFSKLLLGWKIKKTTDTRVKRTTQVTLSKGGKIYDSKSISVSRSHGEAEKEN